MGRTGLEDEFYRADIRKSYVHYVSSASLPLPAPHDSHPITDRECLSAVSNVPNVCPTRLETILSVRRFGSGLPAERTAATRAAAHELAAAGVRKELWTPVVGRSIH